MLTGSFTHYGHTLTLRGYDIAGTVHLLGSSDSRDYENKRYFDAGFDLNGDHIPSDWSDGLIININQSRIKVQKDTYKDMVGKDVHNEVNKPVFSDLGSIVRGLKSACVPTRRKDFNGISYGHESYIPEMTYTYDIDGHTVELTQGEITSMSYISDDGEVSLELREDPDALNFTFPFLESSYDIRIDLSMFSRPVENFGAFAVADDGFISLNDIVSSNPDKSFSWLFDRKYVVATPDNFLDLVKDLAAHKGVIAFDTETTGLKMTFRSAEGIGDTLVGMVFSKSEGESYYFPIAHNYIKNIAPDEEIPYVMERYFKPLLEKKRFVGHNISFDWKTMYTYGIVTNFVADTLNAFRLTLWEKDNSMPLGLKSLSQQFLGRDSLELSDFISDGSWENYSFADLDEESTRLYACADTDNTLALWNYILDNRILEEYNATKVFEIETLFSMCIGYSEYFGMFADPDKMVELEDHLNEEVEKYRKLMVESVGHDFNPGSTKDLQKVIYDELGVPVTKRTAKGAPSTDKDTLKRLGSEENPDGSPKYPMVAYLLKYRENAQLISNFCKTFNTNSNDGFFHSSVRQFLNTGRASVNNPNYQSFNDAAKKYIEARHGYYMFDADFSSVEYRVLVSIAQEQALVDEFFDPDFDYHRRMASMLHGVPYESVTPKIRSQSKGLNFGIPYGMSVQGLAGRMFGDTSEGSIRKANYLYNKYFETQPKVRKFFDTTKANALTNGYSETFYGRRRYYDKRRQNVNSIRRAAGNHPIQGTAADLYKMGIGRLFLRLKERGWLGRVLIDGFVHDEVLIECHNSIDPATLLGLVKEALMVPNEGWCPLYIGAGFGRSWYDAKKIELPVQVQNSIIEAGKVDWWDGDADKLGPWAIGVINGYKLQRMKDYFSNPDNEGKKLPPTELGFITELLESVSKGESIDGFSPGDPGDSGGVEVKPTDNLYDELIEFARVFALHEGIADFVSIPEESEGVPEDFGPGKVTADDISFEEEDEMPIIAATAINNGAVTKMEHNALYIADYKNTLGEAWVKAVNRALKSNPGSYNVYLVDEKTYEIKQLNGLTAAPRTAAELIRNRGVLRRLAR